MKIRLIQQSVYFSLHRTGGKLKKNIFLNERLPADGELFETILKEKNVVIEKILSSNIIPDKEYLQDHDEWVMVVDGEAEILIDNKVTTLSAGDYIFIKSKVPHKVLKTSNGTIWLAVKIF
jgi:cupin 2 domain-containing protein